MNSFFNKTHILAKIVLAIFVPSGSGAAIHKNRPSHGLALNCSGVKKYIFDNGSAFTVQENDIIYLPKSSNYEVTTIIAPILQMTKLSTARLRTLPRVTQRRVHSQGHVVELPGRESPTFSASLAASQGPALSLCI